MSEYGKWIWVQAWIFMATRDVFFLTPCLLVMFAPQMRICADESKRTKANHQKTPFSTAKEISAGEILKNMQRVFLPGRSGRYAPAGGRAKLQLFCSKQVRASSYIRTKSGQNSEIGRKRTLFSLVLLRKTLEKTGLAGLRSLENPFLVAPTGLEPVTEPSA